MLMYLMAGLLTFAQSSPNSNLDAVPGEYLVKMKNSRSAQTLQSKVSGGLTFKGQVNQAGVVHLKLDNPQDFQTLSQDPDVEYIEPNYILMAPIAEKTNLQLFSDGDLQTLSSTTYSQTYAPVQVPQSWAEHSAYSSTNRPIVAVVDTGVYLNHAVFTQSQAIWKNSSEMTGTAGVDDDFNGYVDDFYGWNFYANSNNPNDDEGHGTHVAGSVIGAGLDIFTSPRDQSKILVMPLKFLDANGSGSTSNAIRAIYYAVDNGAQVINCSWGGGSYSRSLLDALAYAYEHQVLVVTAAGNSASNNDVTPMYPAGYDVPANLAVAASTDSDSLASFSNYGASSVGVAAPGQYIYSTYLNGSYALMSGTSMATPFVAGVAALAWREAPNLTGYQIKQLILTSVNTKTSLVSKVSTQGRVNAYNLTMSAKGSVSMASTQPSYKPDYSGDVSTEAASSGGGCGTVRTLMRGGGPGAGLGLFEGVLLLFVGLLPLAVWLTFKNLQTPEQRRQYERFNVKSGIRISMGDRVISGEMKTLSMGGLSFSAEDLIEKGSTVTMKIANPNGGGEIEVEGRIVWSEERKAYGVQFENASQTMREKLLSWTQSLARGKT